MMSWMFHAHYKFDKTFRLFAKRLERFLLKSKFKNGRKSIGAFEKHAVDVNSGGPILPKISVVVRKLKILKVGVTHLKKLSRFLHYLKNLGWGIYAPPPVSPW